MLIRIVTCLMFTLLFAAQSDLQVNAQAYPERPVTIIVPFAPGGSVDAVARFAGQALQEEFKQFFVVDFRPGANSRVGSLFVARAKPDGYTLLLFSGSLMVNPSTQKDLPYDTVKDFAPVGMLGENANVLVVSPKLGVGSLRDLIVLTKSRRLKYGSSGVGGPLHLATELFRSAAQVDIVHVPYKGTGEMFPDLMSGEIDLAVVSIPSGLPFIKSGDIKALAITGAERAASLPDVPTMKEAGIPLETAVPYGLVAPAKTPKDIIKRLNDAIAKALKTDELKRRFAGGEIRPIDMTPDQTAEFIRVEIDRYADIVKKAGIEPGQ
ncbi:Bug family tripartite tricarboxylate transporter substrate binding protein [Neorhizobium tomejilense]|uniref:Bug family tripartite tricarboxylate transporter substrate binding protein n=1 Tax=Neorhizobium tomejilense TaxID=2093828 RepID=UPI003ED07795